MKFCRLNHLNLPQNIDIRGDKNFYGSRKYYFTNQSFHSGRNGDFVVLHVLLTRWQRKAIPKIHDLSLLMGFSIIDNKSSGPQFLEAKPYFSQYFYFFFFQTSIKSFSKSTRKRRFKKSLRTFFFNGTFWLYCLREKKIRLSETSNYFSSVNVIVSRHFFYSGARFPFFYSIS